MSERRESTSSSMTSSCNVKEELSDQPAGPLRTNENRSEQQLGNPCEMDVSMDVQQESDMVETCTTENEVQIKNCLSKCVFCTKIYVPGDDSKLLECLHTACIACINQQLQSQASCMPETDISIPEGNVINCQICNVISHPGNLIENRFFNKLLVDDINLTNEDEPKDEEERKCTNCSENAVATSWCVDCEDWMCKDCVMAHQKLKITKDHTIKPKDEITNDTENLKKKEKKQSPDFYCTVHNREELSLFCQTCDKLTCRDCQLIEHRDHKYKFTHEIAHDTKNAVQELLKTITLKRRLLSSAMDIIEDRQEILLDKKNSIVQDIKKMVVDLNNAITARGKELVKRLDEVCESKVETLNEKKMTLDQLKKLADHCIDFTNYTLKTGTDLEVLYNKKLVTNHLERIKNTRADIPNPELPVRIHLNTDKVQDLIKVISSIGGIIADGRVYPSATPPLESNTPLISAGEPKQFNPNTTVTTALESSSTTQTLPHSSNQSSNNIPYNNTFTNPSLNYSNQHQILLNNPMSNAQMAQQNYPMMQYSVPMQQHTPQNQRMPMYNYNGHIQQQMMGQRPGPGNCHQSQVTSSTHPHHQQQQQQQQQQKQQQQPQQFHVAGTDPIINQNPNLRGLLAHNPPAYRAGVNAQYRFPPRYRYPMNNNQRPIVPTQPYQTAGTSLLANMQIRQQSQPAQQSMLNMYQQAQTQSARWHIPQNINSTVSMHPYTSKNSVGKLSNASLGPANDTYKITLKNQSHSASTSQTNNSSTTSPPISSDAVNVTQNLTAISHTVSSSIPKTPSPALHEKSDETQKDLDNISQGSINELMLTIAKLNRNGIVVNNENEKSQLDSSQVDSSTDEGVNAINDNGTEIPITKEDPNEDWCAVCMDGGDAVLCCDKCPKVFHVYCHIPSLKSFPAESETWQCMLCTNVLDTTDDPISSVKRPHQISARDLRIAQRIVLELYCQYEQSLPFREVVSPEIVEYHKIIKKPIALDVIRERLNPESERHYTDLKQVFSDIRQMFKNAYIFNTSDSQVFQEAKSLEDYFEKLLSKWAPNHAYDDTIGDTEEDVFPPNRKYRRIIND